MTPAEWNASYMRMTAVGRYTSKLNALSKKHAGLIEGTQTSYVQAAFRDLQRGVRSSNPRIAAAADELSEVVGEIFDVTGKGSLMGNAFFRNNARIDVVNDVIATVFREKPDAYIFDLADIQKGARARNADDVAAGALTKERRDENYRAVAAESWRAWDVDNPLDFLGRMYGAVLKVNTDISVAQSFVKMADKQGLMSYLPHEAFFDKAVLGEMHRLDEISRMTRNIDGEVGQWIHRNFDPMQNAWKYGITLPRPGHHIRNFVGDASMTFVAEGLRKAVPSTRDAFKVLALRNDYEGVDIVRSLQHMGEEVLPSGGTVLSTGRYGKAANRRGLLPSYHVGEDYLDDVVQEGGAVKKLTDIATLRGGKIERGLGAVSEYRDHYARLQHFLQFIYKAQEKPGHANMEAMLDAAAHQVKKFHPDGSMLSGFEGKYVRRLMPFYSWFRGALPAIIETTLTQPGRVAAFPKVSYNIAVSMGVDPYSLSDPFPEDQLFPSFLTDQLTGPVFEDSSGNYFNVNPGVAHVDMFNTLGPDPLRGVAGMVTPLVRGPAELLSGGQWSTGAPIKDNSDYIDATIPIVNYISNISGTSVTGSVPSLLSGQGLDPQAQVAAGNKTGADQLTTLSNWLTGMGVQNVSKPNYINYAEIEKRDREGAARG
jgi:hypothetical protein